MTCERCDHNEGTLKYGRYIWTLENTGPFEKIDLDHGWPQDLIDKFNKWEEMKVSALDKAQPANGPSNWEPNKIVSEQYPVTRELLEREHWEQQILKLRQKLWHYETILDSGNIPERLRP